MQNAPVNSYSALAHLGRAVWCGFYDEGNLFAMFTCYFDASGGEDVGVSIVSGWIGQVSQWELFDLDWRLLLAKYDVPYFHMKEFAHSKGPYESWKGQENKRANFLRLAAETIANRVHHGFGCIVEHSIHAEVNQEYELVEAVGNPYCLAARTCIAQANLWVRKSERGVPVHYVLDDGDKGKGQLVSVIEKHNEHVTGSDVIDIPSFQPSRDRPDGRKGLTPLQAADFPAYEYLKAYRLGEDEPLHKYRKSIRVLAQLVDAEPGKFTKQDLITMCQQAGVAKRNKVA